VICDAAKYRGHRGGPWITRWPGHELFHPKIALLVFKQATILLAGSANLTPTAHRDQIEVMGRQVWNRRGLPKPLRPLCRRIGGKMAEQLLKLPPLRSSAFHCSLDGRLAGLFPSHQVDEITIVSPFYDRNESGDPDDFAFVEEVARELSPMCINIVLPAQRHGRTIRLRFPASLARRWAKRLRLFGIFPENHDGRNLHAKLLALHYGGRVKVLYGSANATRAGMFGGNVEAGWWATLGRGELRKWLNQENLLKYPLAHKECEFVASTVSLEHCSCPLISVSLESAKQLKLTWRSKEASRCVRLAYETKPLRVDGDQVRSFRLRRDWHVTVVEGGAHRWCVPIEVADEMAGLRSNHLYTADPEALLASMTGLPENDEGGSPEQEPSMNVSTTPPAQPLSMALFERVRTLTDSMSAARDALNGGNHGRYLATLRLLLWIAGAHDPTCAGLPDEEVVWRYWVRAEVAQVIRHVTDSAARQRAAHASRMLLRIAGVAPHLRKVCQAIRKEMTR
jgi:hypothetical protein